MSIAVCLSGEPRSLKLSADNILNNLIVPNNCDIFIHTWYDNFNSERMDGYCGVFPGTNITGNGCMSKWEDIDYIKILNTFNPKSILIEKQFKFVEKFKIPNWSLGTTSNKVQSMFYSINKANELKQQYEKYNNFTYDYVIRCRLDCIFNQQLKIEQFDNNYVHISNKMHSHGVNDFFAIGNSLNMDKYSSTFNNLHNLHNLCEFNPEIVLGTNLLLNNVPVITYENNKLLFPGIIRSNGTIIRN